MAPTLVLLCVATCLDEPDRAGDSELQVLVKPFCLDAADKIEQEHFPLARNRYREQVPLKPMKLVLIEVSDVSRRSILLLSSLTATSMAGNTAA